MSISSYTIPNLYDDTEIRPVTVVSAGLCDLVIKGTY